MADEKDKKLNVYCPDKDEYPLAVKVIDYYLKEYGNPQTKE